MPQPLDLYEHPWWKLALEHMEQQWPEKLERLLSQGKLKDHLDELVDGALVQKEGEESAGGDEVEGANAAHKWLEPENPDYDEENPKQLSPRGKELLRSFKSRYL